MAQVDDERAIRAVLDEMTIGQPPAPPNRYGAVRRRATQRRRRMLAGAAVAVAILVTGAIAIPLGLLRVGTLAPQSPARHYHISLLRPAPGAPADLVASGVLNQYHWRAYVQLQQNNGLSELCQGSTFGASAGIGWSCGGGPTPASVQIPATSTGNPVQNFTGGGSGPQVDFGTVRSDVAYVTVTYNDGQILTAYPVAVFPGHYAKWIAIPAPYGVAITQMAAYSRTGELGYAVPFANDTIGALDVGRWLRPGQQALPRPARYSVGAGTIAGSSWRDYVHVGPWGTCFVHPTGVYNCFPSLGWLLPPRVVAGQIGSAAESPVKYYGYGQALPAVQYLIMTRAHGGTFRVPAVSVGSRKFFAYAASESDPVTGWTAYDAAGVKLGSGHF